MIVLGAIAAVLVGLLMARHVILALLLAGSALVVGANVALAMLR